MLTKKVKNTEELNDLALSTGARATDDRGKQFNSQQTKAVKPRRLEKNPDAKQIPKKPDPPPPPPGPDAGSQMLAEKIGDVGKSNAVMLEQIRKQIAEIKMQAAQPITRWEFDFIRDDKGYLTRVICDGSPDTKVLN